MLRRAFGAVVLLGACVACSARGPEPLVLATTTSVGNSGLLDLLVPAVDRELRIRLQSHLVGSGQALRMLERGDADVAISHAPVRERDFLANHPGWLYRKIMFNDFVIIGPANDPAGIRGARDAVEAMARIARSGESFVSRGDGSGTDEREQALWAVADVRPQSSRLIVAGQGMAGTLRIAGKMRAYTLSDRATFNQLSRAIESRLLFEGDPSLLNTYAVVVPDRTNDHGRVAGAFATWLADGNGRALIDGFRVRGAPAFHVWPSGRPRSLPTDLPQ